METKVDDGEEKEREVNDDKIEKIMKAKNKR